MPGLQFNLNGGTGQQRQWYNDALAAIKFPFNRMPDFTAQVHWVDEPPMPGHTEFAATLWNKTGDTVNTINVYFRNNLDDPERDPTKKFAGKKFYMETVGHEIGHCVQAFFTASQIADICADVWDADPDAWDPEGPWEDKLSESWAESVKDAYMPRTHRDYDNRTKHRIAQGKWASFCEALEILICRPIEDEGGGGAS